MKWQTKEQTYNALYYYLTNIYLPSGNEKFIEKLKNNYDLNEWLVFTDWLFDQNSFSLSRLIKYYVEQVK